MYRREMKKLGSQVLLVVIWAAAAIALMSCKEDATDLQDGPRIELVSVAPTSIVEYQDSVLFRISYKDGNGDLGENRAGVYNLFLIDKRIDTKYPYRIPEIVPGGRNAPIQGSFTFSLRNALRTDSLPEQSYNYEIYVVDRAGNVSNTVATPTVTVRAE